MLSEQQYNLYLSKLNQYTLRNKPASITLHDLPISPPSSQSQHKQQQFSTSTSNTSSNHPNDHHNINNDSELSSVNNFLSHINKQLQRQSSLFDQAITQFSEIFKLMYDKNRQLHHKIQQQSHQIDIYSGKIQEIKWNYSAVQNQRDILLADIKRKNDQLELYKINIQQLQRQYQTQKSVMKQKLIQEQQNTQKNMEVFTQIKYQNDNINKSMRQTYDQKYELEQHVGQLLKEIQEKQKIIIKMEGKLDWEGKGKKKLEEDIKKKQQIIAELEGQIEILKENQKRHFGGGHMGYDVDMFSPPEDSIQEIQQLQSSKVKLSEDVQNKYLQNKLQFQLKPIEHKKSQDAIAINKFDSLMPITNSPPPEHSISQTQPQIQSRAPSSNIPSSPSKIPKSKKPLDPYYCHYVLLSQTIKVIQNQQTFYNIDVKPFYKEIINQNVPMFQWREWILEKFREIVNNKEINNGSSNGSKKNIATDNITLVKKQSVTNNKNGKNQDNKKCL